MVLADATHPLVEGAREHFAGASTADSGHLRPKKRRLVDLCVTEDSLDRALTFASKLFSLLESRGYMVRLPTFDQHLHRPALDERKERVKRREPYERRHGTWSPDRPTVVSIGSVALGLAVFEQSARVEVQYLDGKFVPVTQIPASNRREAASPTAWTSQRELACGRLCVRASSPYVLATWERYWEETAIRPLDSAIKEIVRGLEDAAVVVAAMAQEGAAKAEAERIAWDRQRAEWRRSEAERASAKLRQESRDQLAEIISTWSAAKAREDFFDELGRHAAMLDAESQSMLRTRIHRARAMLGGIDTLERFALWRDVSAETDSESSSEPQS